MNRVRRMAWIAAVLAIPLGCARVGGPVASNREAGLDGGHSLDLAARRDLGDSGAADSRPEADGHPSPDLRLVSLDATLRQIEVTSPAPGALLDSNSTATVAWELGPGAPPTVDIELWRGSTRTRVMATGRVNTGTFTWQIPAGVPADDIYRVRILSSDTSVGGLSGYFGINGWKYRREITIDATDATDDLLDHQVLVVLTPTNFDYDDAAPGAADLRVGSTSELPDPPDLPHWIDSWSVGGQSKLWVRVPRIAAGETTRIYLYYGRDATASTSSLEATFPSRFSAGAAVELGGTVFFDYFSLPADHTISLPTQVPLVVRAHKIIVDGTIDGRGKGSAGGGVYKAGTGQGAGTEPSSRQAGGGGGHGGEGGRGAGSTIENGGAIYDSPLPLEHVFPGSGGSGADGRGGAGGGSVILIADDLSVAGTIDCGGEAGANASRGGGGGSGGGILLAAYRLVLTGTLRVPGGPGGDGTGFSGDGGGGGGGGRIRLRHEDVLLNNGTQDLTPGDPGQRSAEGQPGEAGALQTFQVPLRGYGVTIGPSTRL